ncbi:MAG: class I SAM-dependent methyltransferase family protein [Candidatus Obscuribacterales bacterium]|jgi:SAM-dependent methyltransferase|nr:class I SAM-dependent methyltransferase family protein [Candidatus Obscuribacterales bacterium]
MNKSKLANVFCHKKMKYGFIRLLFRTLGRLSEGIRIGWKYGFDSGESLDYVYENRACGLGPLGKLFDRIYLNSAGWSGIRSRRVNMQQAISWAIDHSKDSAEQLELIDVASGPGRYVLDVLSAGEPKNLHATLYDLDEVGLAIGRQKAAALNLSNVDFVKRNAFQYVSGCEREADIAIVSGLYELFSDNDLISTSLRSISSRMKDGGYLIYTNQPWHPQLEFIANVLDNREGKPWVMRCRSQEEIDKLVEDAGFCKISMKSDDAGIFTVSIATKRNQTLKSLQGDLDSVPKCA